MKLLIITQVIDTTHPILGFFHGWVKEFAKHYESVEVICLQVGKHDLPSNVTVHSLGKELGGSKFSYLFRFYSLVWGLRKDYDHVFVHMNQIYVLLGAILWRILGKKTGLWYAHGHMSLLVKVASWLSDLVFTSTTSGFRYDTPKKIITGQGIDTNRFYCSGERNNNVLQLVYVGRTSPIKGIDVLLEACRIIKEKGVKFHLSIIGSASTPSEADYLKILESLTKVKSLETEVTFVGQVQNTDLPRYLCQADIFINPSSTGSLDKTGVEAMSSGVVVLTCNEAYADVLGEFSSELMFKKGDASDIADKVISFSSNERRQIVGAKLREIVVKSHSIERLMALISEKLKSIR